MVIRPVAAAGPFDSVIKRAPVRYCRAPSGDRDLHRIGGLAAARAPLRKCGPFRDTAASLVRSRRRRADACRIRRMRRAVGSRDGSNADRRKVRPATRRDRRNWHRIQGRQQPRDRCRVLLPYACQLAAVTDPAALRSPPIHHLAVRADRDLQPRVVSRHCRRGRCSADPVPDEGCHYHRTHHCRRPHLAAPRFVLASMMSVRS